MIIHKRTRREYHSPRVVTAQVDTMSALCTSVRFNVQVDELHNMNTDDDGVAGGAHYFEF